MENDNNTKKGPNKTVIIAIILIFGPIVLLAGVILLFFVRIAIHQVYLEKVLLPQIEKEAMEYVHNTYGCSYDIMAAYDVVNETDGFLGGGHPKGAKVICGRDSYSVYYDSELGWTDKSVNKDLVYRSLKSPEYKSLMDRIQVDLEKEISKYTNIFFTRSVIRGTESIEYTNRHEFVIFIDVSKYTVTEIVSLMNNIINAMESDTKLDNNNTPISHITYSLFLLNDTNAYDDMRKSKWTYPKKEDNKNMIADEILKHLNYETAYLLVNDTGMSYALSTAEETLNACKYYTTDNNCGNYDNKLIYFSNLNQEQNGEKRFSLYGVTKMYQ